MSNSERARERLLALLEKGYDQPDEASDGAWSSADFDEIEILSESISSSLPRKFISILSQGYAWRADEQIEMAERLIRVLNVHSEFSDLSGNLPESLEPTFILNKSEKSRVLELTSKMRKIVLASVTFDEAHKRRLLNRINSIEKQVHQEKGLLDVVLAGVSDVGDTLKKFGTDLKPLSDRMAEVKRITQSNSAEYDQIPSGEELDALPKPETDPERDD